MKKFGMIKISPRDIQGITEIWTPNSKQCVEESRTFELGGVVVASADPKDIRNVKFHRKFFALLRLVFDNLPEKYAETFKSLDHLRQEILMQIGAFEVRESMGGKTYYIPKSMKFGEMKESEFEEIYDKTLDFITKYILPEVKNETFELELNGYL